MKAFVVEKYGKSGLARRQRAGSLASGRVTFWFG